MQKYSKLIVAVIGVVAAMAVDYGFIPAGGEAQLVSSLVQIATLFGILVVPAKGYNGKW